MSLLAGNHLIRRHDTSCDRVNRLALLRHERFRTARNDVQGRETWHGVLWRDVLEVVERHPSVHRASSSIGYTCERWLVLPPVTEQPSASASTDRSAASAQAPDRLALRESCRERSELGVGDVERLEPARQVLDDAIDRAREVQVRESEVLDLRLRREERWIDVDPRDEAFRDAFVATAASDRSV